MSEAEAEMLGASRRAAPNFDRIPAELKALPRWVLWRIEKRGGKSTKVPIRVSDPSRRASSTDPATWATFEEARAAFERWQEHGRADGVGFVLTREDKIVGIDFDHCRASGEWDTETLKNVFALGSYTEVSPSGDGLHVFAYGSVPGERCRRGNIEIYDHDRFFTVTGAHLDGTPTAVKEAPPGSIESLYATIDPTPDPTSKPVLKTPATATMMDDDEIIERARAAANGAKFSSLFDVGSTVDYSSASEADAALCALLRFWTQDPYQMERIFKRSRLMRDKWDTKRGKSTYGLDTIERAIGLGGETYTPPSSKRSRSSKELVAAVALAEDLERFVYRLPRGGIKVDEAAVGEYLYETFNVVSFNGTLYIYRDGVYRQNRGQLEAEVKRIVQSTGTHEQLTRVTREVREHLLYTAPFETYPFNQVPDLIPVANGVIRIDYETETVELLPHSPGFRFTYQLPTVYDPDADGAPMRAVFGEYVEADALDVLYEIPAVALLQMNGQQPFKRSYIIQGEANSGKSTYLLVLTEFIGPDNVSGVSLHQITNDRFAFADMESKILNIYDELKDIPLKDIGQFKKLTGSYKHRVERKHEAAYEGRITCPLVFSCNTPPGYPESEEYESAWWGRWEYLNFVNVFPVDPSFHARVVTPAALSGVLNDVIKAMIHIHKQGLYRDPDPGRVKGSWKLASDLFKEFLEDEMVPVATGMEIFEKGPFLSGFRRWCMDKNKPENKIPRDLQTFAPMVFRNGFIPRQVGKEQKRVYSGSFKFREGSKYATLF